MTGIGSATGERLRADAASSSPAAPGSARLFPDLLGRRIFPTRQEIFFFAPPPGDASFAPGRLPGWADFNDGDMYYGFPDLEGRGFKIAHDRTARRSIRTRGDRIAFARRAGRRARVHGAALPAHRRTGRSTRRASANMRTARTAIS